MLEFAGINVWAVVAVWFLYIVLGAFWYSPAGFAKQWTKHTGIDILKMPKNKANRAIGSVAASALVQVLALAVILNSLHAADATAPTTAGFLAGLVLWLGFTAATTVGVTLYSRRSWGYLWLNSSYFLIVMTVGSVILSVWK